VCHCKCAFELIRAAEPGSPVLEELRCRGNESCYHQRHCNVSYVASQTLILKLIHSMAIVSRLNLNSTVLHTMASYAAADCHFSQDAHRRMALVIARVRRAEERERGERAQDSQCVNGEKIFRLLSSAECTEVVCHRTVFRVTTSSRHQDRQGSSCAAEEGQGLCTMHTSGARFFQRRSPDCLQIYLSPGNSAPDHNEMLAHITKIHCYAERLAMGDGNAPTPQVVRPPAPRQFSSSNTRCLVVYAGPKPQEAPHLSHPGQGD
jgi:hypothetical protein